MQQKKKIWINTHALTHFGTNPFKSLDCLNTSKLFFWQIEAKKVKCSLSSKVPFIVVSPSAPEHPSSVMVRSSCHQWQHSGISVALAIETFRSLFMIVIMLSTLKKIKTTLTKRWRQTLGAKSLGKKEIFCTLWQTHTALEFLLPY